MQSICVYLGSRDAVDPKYHQLAKTVGQTLGQRGDRLIFGGNEAGLMKTLADASRDAGAKVLGIIPKSMIDQEAPNPDLIITPDLHSRKKTMQQYADAFLVLPGGIGTLEEFFETLTLKYLKDHHKPIILINLDGFFDPLLEALAAITHQDFIKPATLNLYSIASNPAHAFELLDQALS